MGDILATRLRVRGVRGAVVDGRVRDLTSLAGLVSDAEDGTFQIWNKGTSTVGTGMEAKAWAVDVPLTIGNVVVKAVSAVHVGWDLGNTNEACGRAIFCLLMLRSGVRW